MVAEVRLQVKLVAGDAVLVAIDCTKMGKLIDAGIVERIVGDDRLYSH